MVVGFISEHTCGVACWTAKDDICHCSCGGSNHGCLRSGNGQRPIRTAKIDGVRYELKAVGGRELYKEAETINEAPEAGYKDVLGPLKYPWRETDKGAPARIKPANHDQVEKWPELSSWRGKDLYFHPAILLWVKL
jgi:hypothetical protein